MQQVEIEDLNLPLQNVDEILEGTSSEDEIPTNELIDQVRWENNQSIPGSGGAPKGKRL